MKAVYGHSDFVYTDSSVSYEKAAAATIIDNFSSIERLPDKSTFCKLHALNLALDQFATSDDDKQIFITFSEVCPTGHLGQGLDTSPCPKAARTPSLAGTVH